jgi:hypothetical protein
MDKSFGVSINTLKFDESGSMYATAMHKKYKTVPRGLLRI